MLQVISGLSHLQTVDPAPIPAAQKASLRDQLAALQKQVLEGQKKASAANKQRATQAAVADADAAVAAGQKFGVIRVDVGLDPKALLEAWNAIQKQHAQLPVIMFSTDQGKPGTNDTRHNNRSASQHSVGVYEENLSLPSMQPTNQPAWLRRTAPEGLPILFQSGCHVATAM